MMLFAITYLKALSVCILLFANYRCLPKKEEKKFERETFSTYSIYLCASASVCLCMTKVSYSIIYVFMPKAIFGCSVYKHIHRAYAT